MGNVLESISVCVCVLVQTAPQGENELKAAVRL